MGTHLDIYQQIRTHQGRLPAKKTTLGKAAECEIGFTLCSPADADLPERQADPGFVLEDLGLCRGISHMQEMAAESGPLFGAAEHEHIAAWECAITAASIAVMAQFSLNRQAIDTKNVVGIEKEAYTNAQTGASCLVYTCVFPVRNGNADEYLRWIGRVALPWSRRFPDGQRIDYAVAYLAEDDENDRTVATIHLFSVADEISPDDFAALLETFIDDEETSTQLNSQLDESQFLGSMEESSLRFHDASASFTTESMELNDGDGLQLQHMIQAIASLHMEGIHMDVFLSQSSDGFMVFPSYLSYLWFKFAQNLANVKVAMCPICGNGFSKAGHRGPDKIYCSERCKATARNKKSAAKRDEVRRLFLDEGKSVAEIRRAKINGERIGWSEERIVRELRGWVRLRHERAKSPELAKRCLREGIVDEREAAATLKAYARARSTSS